MFSCAPLLDSLEKFIRIVEEMEDEIVDPADGDKFQNARNKMVMIRLVCYILTIGEGFH